MTSRPGYPVGPNAVGSLGTARGRFIYWATGAAVDRMVSIGEADSVREAWHEASCECGWETSGSEPNVEDAAHEHVSEMHKAEVDAELLYLAGARAYCEAKYNYESGSYNTADDRERHIQADAATHARGEAFRAAIDAVLAAVAAAAPPAPSVVPDAGAACQHHPGCWVRPVPGLAGQVLVHSVSELG